MIWTHFNHVGEGCAFTFLEKKKSMEEYRQQKERAKEANALRGVKRRMGIRGSITFLQGSRGHLGALRKINRPGGVFSGKESGPVVKVRE